MGSSAETSFVSRAGVKLQFGLDAFELDVTGLLCADLGCNVGGFTDCLLRRGAARVYAVDTGYGVLHYRLRGDPRVVVMERSNMLHCPVPAPCDLVAMDLGWTRQRHAMPAALRWLAPGGRIVSLIKPHYELDEPAKRTRLVRGVLSAADAELVLQQVVEGFPALGAEVLAIARSPIGGAKSARRSRGEGNREYLALVRRISASDRSG
jgi:23S rRNA (cytidine1920-2'-O)/16S rRNA (cytidine1409-2'-O)-methyltransferase